MVKKIAFLSAMILLAAGVVYAKSYHAVNKAGTYQVTLKMEKDPVPVAENKALIEIKDSSGAFVTDAEVGVHYFMPSMPAMNYGAKTEVTGNGYGVVMKPTMPGDWEVDVKIRDRAGKVHKAVFEFRAK
jgi:hypothetical protein